MARFYSADDVHQALPWAELAEALAHTFRAGAQTPVRHRHDLSAQDCLLLMPAWDEELVVLKTVTVMLQAAHPVQAQVLALDRRSGDSLALMDGEAVTLRRTAATSALAARELARPDSRRLLVLGAGHLAGWMVRAHCALRPGLQEVRLWARRPPAAQALAQTLRAEGLPVQAVDAELAAEVAQADIVCTVTTAHEPLLRGAWLREGTHLDLVGAFKADMREVDDEAVRRSRVVADTLAGCLAEAGDLVQPLRAGVIAPTHVLGELADVLRGQLQARQSARDITLFKSVGSALEDLAAARMVLARRMA